jgi:hypothetical protein
VTPRPADIGVLAATTAFGKTVVAARMIAKRGVNTLVLVHRQQLMEQWVEGRIPLEAVELAKEFWGWPDEYSRDESPRKGQDRVYWNWRPQWRIWDVATPGNVTTQEVRMYMYENSSDFRFYVRPLVNAGADLGDVVRIRRIAQPDAEFECVLARQGTPQFDDWSRSCTQPVRNSTRSFGYA